MSEKRNIPVIDANEILKGIREWVNIESPSNDGESVNRQVDAVEVGAAKIGAVIERIPGRDGFGDILKVCTPWGGGGDGPGMVVILRGVLNSMMSGGGSPLTQEVASSETLFLTYLKRVFRSVLFKWTPRGYH